jgi:hypothetical protein
MASTPEIVGAFKPATKARSGRFLLMPVLLNAWPILLFVSQKALVPLGLLAAGASSRKYVVELLIAALMLALAALVLVIQVPNEYGAAHYVGYALFVLSVPVINHAIRVWRDGLIKWLAVLSILNALIAFAIYFTGFDTGAFRGLNRVVGTDELTHRVYFEATSLVAVFSVRFFRSRVVRAVALAIVLGYVLFLAKSIVVIALYVLNLVAPAIIRVSLAKKIGILILGVAVLVAAPILVSLLRPDVALSIGIKLLQLQSIADYPGTGVAGAGWGYVIDEIVNSVEQPYQVEMQLPMLWVQVGVLGLLPYLLGLWVLVRGVSSSGMIAWARYSVYIAIGFNNPWLFVPSWYLTAALLFSDVEGKDR